MNPDHTTEIGFHCNLHHWQQWLRDKLPELPFQNIARLLSIETVFEKDTERILGARKLY